MSLKSYLDTLGISVIISVGLCSVIGLCNRTLKLRRKRRLLNALEKESKDKTKLILDPFMYCETNNFISTLSDLKPTLFIPGIVIIDGIFDEQMETNFFYQYYNNVGINNIEGINLSNPLTIIVRSFGGSGYSLEKIMNVLKKHRGYKTCYIHEYAFSCGTIVALSCDKVYMKKTDWISPIDTQFPSFFGSTSILKLYEQAIINICNII